MGWAAGDYTYPVSMSKSDIGFEINDSLEKERGYFDPEFLPFVFLEEEGVFKTKEEAEKRMLELGKKYDRSKNYGVRYLEYPEPKKTKKMEDIERRIKETEQKYIEYQKIHSVLSFKAEFVGCPNCKSKLNRSFIKNDFCPLCGADMRSDTTRNVLKGYNDKIKELKKQLKEETTKQEKKMASKAEEYWLIHAEVYLG